MKVSASSFTVKISLIKDNACSKAGIAVNELWETFTIINKLLHALRVMIVYKENLLMRNLSGIIIVAIILVSLAFIFGVFLQDILLLALGLIAVILLASKLKDNKNQEAAALYKEQYQEKISDTDVHNDIEELDSNQELIDSKDNKQDTITKQDK